jgi:hypothetical protein
VAVLLVVGLAMAVVVAGIVWPPLFHPIKLYLFGRASVSQRVKEYGEGARARLAPFFAEARMAYPPARFSLVGLKDEKRLDLYAADETGPYAYVRSYPILAASGRLGPKLREGDRQVPEGIYRIESLNPNSRYHLALRLDYPNERDRARAAEDGRPDLGSDIMIHGRNASIGCLAMGDEAAEELFVLAADAGWSNAEVVLSPVDLRSRAAPAELTSLTRWTGSLYEEMGATLGKYPSAESLKLEPFVH